MSCQKAIVLRRHVDDEQNMRRSGALAPGKPWALALGWLPRCLPRVERSKVALRVEQSHNQYGFVGFLAVVVLVHER